MKQKNYIFQLILNQAAKDELVSKNVSLIKNEFINDKFINDWNKQNENTLMKYIEEFKYLFNISNIYQEIIDKLNAWYFDFRNFEIYSKQDLKEINEICSKQNEIDKNNFKEFVDKNNSLQKLNNTFECSTIEKTKDLIDIEQRRNYILKQVFHSIYFQIDELMSIIYFILLNNESQNSILKDKLKSLSNIEWFTISNNDQILLAEIMSMNNYFKTWKDVSFPMTDVKLDEFLILINKIYLIIEKNVLMLSGFTNKVKDVYYKMCELNLIK